MTRPTKLIGLTLSTPGLSSGHTSSVQTGLHFLVTMGEVCTQCMELCEMEWCAWWNIWAFPVSNVNRIPAVFHGLQCILQKDIHRLYTLFPITGWAHVVFFYHNRDSKFLCATWKNNVHTQRTRTFAIPFSAHSHSSNFSGFQTTQTYLFAVWHLSWWQLQK